MLRAQTPAHLCPQDNRFSSEWPINRGRVQVAEVRGSFRFRRRASFTSSSPLRLSDVPYPPAVHRASLVDPRVPGALAFIEFSLSLALALLLARARAVNA